MFFDLTQKTSIYTIRNQSAQGKQKLTVCKSKKKNPLKNLHQIKKKKKNKNNSVVRFIAFRV